MSLSIAIGLFTWYRYYCIDQHLQIDLKKKSTVKLEIDYILDLVVR